jgi:hypothetical protein
MAISIEQAIFGGYGAEDYRCWARSSGFLEDWLPQAQRLCAGFGERPAGVDCPGCVFAQPLGRRHVAVVQVADLGAEQNWRPGPLGFRLLILARADYSLLGADPFSLAERFPPPWQSRGDLPVLSMEASPPRTVADVQQVLKRPDGPILLGGVQALVDGGRLVFQRPAPDTSLLQSLWALLPVSNRRELWPASFAFGNELGFDALVVSRPNGKAYAGYLIEEQAGDYPQGRYELSLQIAAEAGDQGELDSLFARRSRAQTWRLGLILLVVMSGLVFGVRLLNAVFQSAGGAANKAPAPSSAPSETAKGDKDSK